VAIDDEELRRRVRAGQAIAGLKSVDEMAERIDIPGLGRDTLYDMLRGKRPIRRHELREIADACRLPLAFFEVENFDVLATHSPELADHDRRMDELAHRQLGLIEQIAEVAERLDQRTERTDEGVDLLIEDLKVRLLDPDSVPTPADALDGSSSEERSPSSRPRRERSDPTGSQA
jgi:hypothetical protein